MSKRAPTPKALTKAMNTIKRAMTAAKAKKHHGGGKRHKKHRSPRHVRGHKPRCQCAACHAMRKARR